MKVTVCAHCGMKRNSDEVCGLTEGLSTRVWPWERDVCLCGQLLVTHCVWPWPGGIPTQCLVISSLEPPKVFSLQLVQFTFFLTLALQRDHSSLQLSQVCSLRLPASSRN